MNEIKMLDEQRLDDELDLILMLKNPNIEPKTKPITTRVSDSAAKSIEMEMFYFDITGSAVIRQRLKRYIKKSFGRLSEKEMEERYLIEEAMNQAKNIPLLSFLIVKIYELENELRRNPCDNLKAQLTIYKKEVEWRKLQPQKFDEEAAAEAAEEREVLNIFMNALSQQRLKS